MPSRFDRVGVGASRGVNRVFGERLRFRPQREAGRGGEAGGDDPARALNAPTFTGALTRAPLTLQRSGEGGQGSSNVKIAPGQWMLWIDAVEAARLGAKAGDIIERDDPPPGEPARLRLSAPLPTDGGIVHPLDPV